MTPLDTIAKRVARLRPHPVEAFVAECSKLVRAIRVEAAARSHGPTPTAIRVEPDPADALQIRRLQALVCATRRDVERIRDLLRSAIRPVRKRTAEPDVRQLTMDYGKLDATAIAPDAPCHASSRCPPRRSPHGSPTRHRRSG